MRWRRAGSIALAGVLVVVALSVAGVLALRYVGIDAARDLVVQRLEAITGREVVIEGDFDLVPSLTPTLAADGIVVANAPWASKEPMLDAERVEVSLQLMPLVLRGALLIDRLTIGGAYVLLETGAEGRANWRFDASVPDAAGGDGDGRDFLLNEVAIQDSRVRLRDAGTGEVASLVIDRFGWRAPAVMAAVDLSGSGTIDGRPFEVAGQAGPLAELLAGDGAYPVLLEGTLGGMSADIEGDVELAQDDLDLQVRIMGERFARLGGLAGTELPELGPYTVAGRLTGPVAAPALLDLSGRIGEEGTPWLSITGGTIADVLSGEGMLVELEAKGSELARLAAAFGIEMAPFGPYTASGTLTGSLESPALTGLEATAGDEATRVMIAGAIGNLLELSGVELTARAEGSDLAGLSPLVGVALPPSEPYRIAGDVTGSSDRLRVEELEVEIADSHIGGWLAAEGLAAGPPRIEGELVAERLDVDRLLPDAGGEPHEAGAAEVVEAGTGLFATSPLPLAWLDDLEAEIAVRADRLLLDRIDFENASFSVALQKGRLSVQDLVLETAGGSLTGGAALEARDDADLAEVTVRLAARDVDVRRLLTDWAATERFGGEIDIDINVDATGRSLDELMASLDGTAVAVAEDGQIRDAPLNRLVTDLDILRALPPFWRRNDDDVRINCLIAEMDIESGVARTEAMLDTRRMTLLGEGTVDLDEEQLDLVLRPEAKGRKLSKLAVPVDVTGGLADPEVRPRTGRAVGQAIRGVLGGLLIPLNQLTALFGKETVDACKQALDEAAGQAAADASRE